MNREQLLQRIDAKWSAFNASYAGLSEADLMEAGVTGEWSVRDLLAHISIWDAEAIKHLPLIVSGGTPPRYADVYGGIDAFNAQMIERTRDLSITEVQGRLEETHQRLIDYLENVPEHFIATETRFRRRLRLDTYGHYPRHTKAIEDWRAQRLS